MKTVNVHEAKTHLSRLLEALESGEEVVIGRAGRPVAVLKPFQPARKARKPGSWKGRVRIAADFDLLPESVLRSFHGGAKPATRSRL